MRTDGVRGSKRRLRRLVVVAAVAAATAVHPLAMPSSGVPTSSEVGARAPQPPEGFSDTVVAEVDAPTALAWTPDGRMLVTSKPGRVIVHREDGTSTTALDIRSRICDDTERGLVGVAVDPEFESNRFLYLYYTHEAGGDCGPDGPHPANRVGRFVLRDDDTISRSSETIIVDRIVSPAGNHIAGDLEFGEDGYLYISTGDGTCSIPQPSQCGPTNDNSQRLNLPHGKILRVTRSGAPPSTNPFADAPGARRCTNPDGVPPGTGPCKEIFASGLRNPFRFARKPGTSQFYVNDVGRHTWEEVNVLRKGANYGWNVREGHCRRDSTTDCGPAGRFTNPIHDYRHGECRSVTGGAFVPAGVWKGWAGSYLFSDFACGRIFRLQRKPEGGFRRTTFLSGAEGPVHLRFGPSGDGTALYYLSYFGGEVHRVTQTTENTAPEAAFTYRPDGLTVSFSGAASSDPDAGDEVREWVWDFGDGTSATTTAPRTAHTYDQAGPVEVTLTVRDQQGRASAPAAATVPVGEHPPDLVITQPDEDAEFAVGEQLTLSARATDDEDGAIPGSQITWTLRLRHGNHHHPHQGPDPGGSVTTTYPAPEDLVAARSSRLVALASVVDSAGLTTVVRRALLPKTVELTFRTAPGGGHLVVEGDRRSTPLRVESWVGHTFPVRAPDQALGGVPHAFVSWSDGGAREHDITTPATPMEYVARYRRQ